LPPDVLPIQWLRGAFEHHGLPAPHVALETTSLTLRLHAVGSSKLLGFVPEIALREAARRLKLVQLRVKELTWSRRASQTAMRGRPISGLSLCATFLADQPPAIDVYECERFDAGFIQPVRAVVLAESCPRYTPLNIDVRSIKANLYP
jgi:hypothetical protein